MDTEIEMKTNKIDLEDKRDDTAYQRISETHSMTETDMTSS